MRKTVFKISALLLGVIFVLSGCGGNSKVSYSDNSVNINISSEDTSSEEQKGNETSDTETPSQGAPDKNVSGKGNQSNTSSGETSSENTSSETFAKPTVQGGTVIGTTSKGFAITQKNGITYIDGLLVVNKTYALPENYNPGLQSLCNSAFNKMKTAAKKDGISIWISSGFRSYKTQKSLYDAYCQRDGVAAADRYSARPGYSEHQSGFAIDVNSASTVAYESTYKAVGEWLEEHCWEYGFIIRYPENKEGITGYKYEPWHIRYVGSELSMLLKESGQTLEEYFGISSYYSSDVPPEDGNSSTESGNNSESGEEPSLPKDNESETEIDENDESAQTP